MAAERVVGDRYRLRGKLGSGGMGTVWRAYDERLHREVAVKEIVLAAVLSPEARADVGARAMVEARSAARLNHPNIVGVHDVFADGDTTFIVMTLVNGSSLQEAVDANGPLPPARAAQLGLGLLDALDAAHAAGILHRDVKPSNVMLPAAGGVLLTDFSIAAAADSAGLTRTGVLVGTPGYVAPERVITGRSGPAVDMFGLGATLYFATEGRGPFDREATLASLFATVNDPSPVPKHAGPLAPVIDGLLVKAPSQRWSSARSRADLQRIAAVGGATARPFTRDLLPDEVPDDATLAGDLPAAALRSGRGRRWVAPVLAAVTVVAALAAVTVFVANRPAGPGNTAAATTAPPASSTSRPPVSSPAVDCKKIDQTPLKDLLPAVTFQKTTSEGPRYGRTSCLSANLKIEVYLYRDTALAHDDVGRFAGRVGGFTFSERITGPSVGDESAWVDSPAAVRLVVRKIDVVLVIEASRRPASKSLESFMQGLATFAANLLKTLRA